MTNETKRNDITELVFILDRSGSMHSLRADTIGGFNTMLEKQKREPGDCYVTTVLFDHEMITLHDRLPIGEVPLLTEQDYQPRGSTALLDAVGRTIRHIARIHRYARPEDVPERTLFVITTDGMENASSRYTADQVRQMVQHEQEKYGWEFLFLGANLDAVETASRIGIRADRAANYNADGMGTGVLYESVSRAVSQVRACAPLSASWREDVDKDYARRRKQK